MRALVLLCICRVLALAGPNCQSEITKDCGTATGDACKKCVESHGLHKHGCTNAQIASICAGGPSPTPPSPGPAGNVLTKVLLNNSDPSAIGGRCGDGSPSGYYYAGAQPSATNKWVIHMKGGGACQTEASCKGWMAQKGSSKNWIPTIDGNPHLEPLIDGDSAQNPDFHTWNRVRVNYCTGDFHAGQRTGPSADTWNYWFDGHLNVQRVISDLKAKHGLGNATHVLVSGESAGGIGLFVNIDYIASLLPDDTVVKGAPQAGWFFPEDPVATPKGAGFPLTFEAKEITHSTALPFNVSNGDPLQHRLLPPPVSPPNSMHRTASVHTIYTRTSRLLCSSLRTNTTQLRFMQIMAARLKTPKGKRWLRRPTTSLTTVPPCATRSYCRSKRTARRRPRAKTGCSCPRACPMPCPLSQHWLPRYQHQTRPNK